MKKVELSYLFDDQSYHGAYKCHILHRYKKWVIIRSILCILMILFGGYLMTATVQREFGYIFIAAGSIGFLRPMIWQMWHERIARKNPAYGTKVNYLFNSEGVTISGTKGSFLLRWADLYELTLTKKGLLIYQTKKQYLWIPLSALKGSSSEIERLYSESL